MARRCPSRVVLFVSVTTSIFGWMHLQERIALLTTVRSIPKPATSSYAYRQPQPPQQEEDIEPCTFSDLVQAFSPQQQEQRNWTTSISSTHLSSSHKDTSSCWSLAESILRIPVSAILNRDTLVHLGHGRKGLVHKAIVSVSSVASHARMATNQPYRPACSVALKTDCCHHPPTKQLPFHPFSNTPSGRGDESCVSCVSSGSVLKPRTSFMGGEYIGALLFYSQLERQRQQQQQRDGGTGTKTNIMNTDTMEIDFIPGLLPTWAVVVDPKHHLRHRFVPGPLLGGVPHPDRSILGTVMPLLPFRSVDDWNVSQIAQNSTQFSRLFLSAAKGILYANHEVGLAFQDIKGKNVGVTHDGQTSFIYDHGYVSVQQNHVDRSHASKYCPERVFRFPVDRHSDWFNGASSRDNIESDYLHFRNVLLVRVKYCSDEARATKLQEAIGQSSTLEDLVSTLERFSDPDYLTVL